MSKIEQLFDKSINESIYSFTVTRAVVVEHDNPISATLDSQDIKIK